MLQYIRMHPPGFSSVWRGSVGRPNVDVGPWQVSTVCTTAADALKKDQVMIAEVLNSHGSKYP